MRCREVLRLLSDGLPDKQIAAELRISERTVRHHVARCREILNASNRSQLVAIAARLNLLGEREAMR